MGKQRNKRRFEDDQHMGHGSTEEVTFDKLVYYPVQKLEGKSEEQSKFISALYNSDLVVGIGRAGTGKSFAPAVVAYDMLMNPSHDVNQIILVRPNIPLGPTLGFAKGTIEEKMAPWIAPIKDPILWRMCNGSTNPKDIARAKKHFSFLVENEMITYQAVEHLRGRSFSNAIVICDEAENMGKDAMKCLLTRMGDNSKLIVVGDHAQKDLKGSSGLELIERIHNYAIEEFGRSPIFWNNLNTVVRSDTCAFMLDALEHLGE